ncbi:hypothetical protein KC19_11G079200 [Ceratodon purpureus]|uniref:Formin-like protein n=1 Tax=Ceratodon purpureus TaxID=3225 RepID=A0A8T0GI14_CERPU|nr:hypothetical protein KC19_11G079200 [Ceratodon purpureus]
MSNSTLVAPAKAPVNVSAPVPSLAPAPFVTPASSPSGTLVVPKVPPSYNISWIGIVGILVAFLVLAVIALFCFWSRKRAFKRALKEQRELYAANDTSPTLKADWSDDEEAARRKTGQIKLADFEQALGTHFASKGFNGKGNVGNGDTTSRAGKILEQDIPMYTRDKHVVESFKEKHVGNLGIRNKNMSGGFNWNSLGDTVEDEVFYKGEGGSQMGVRYSSSDFDNLDIFSRVPLSPREQPKKRPEGESASLLGSFSRSHTIAVSPDEGKLSSKTGWTLRTLSLPPSRQKPSSETQDPPKDASVGLKVDVRVESLSKGIGSLSSQPNSLPSSPKHSYSPKFAYGNHTLAPWNQKPSRLSVQSNAVLHNPTFIVPPSTPPPPLPLPASLEETEEKTLIELRKAMKQAETKWSIENYCPSAPPPPLPVPFQSSTPAPSPPSTSPSASPKPKSAPPPPPPPPPPRPFPTLPCKRFPQPPSPPPPPTLPSRNSTPPPSPPPPSSPSELTPPPSSPHLSDNGSRKPTPPPTPPPSPPPPELPGSASRPKLTPLILPGRPDLGENAEAFRTEARPPRRSESKMRPLHWDKLKPESRTTMVWDKISNSMELDEEMIENLFGVTARAASENDGVKRSPFTPIAEKNEILDPRKAHNIAIQLRARGLSRVEVCDALLDGDGLGQEILEILVKMTPTDEEITKFQEYQGDPTLLGPADRFIRGILQIPSAFERLQAMHYRALYGEDLHHIQDTITTLEMACKELKGSRTFTKLLEAVLKTGNRLNTGTFRGDAKAFKLDTLLKLADVKGVDGKTTLLHFVIQEIIKAEGARAARMAGFHDPSTPTSSTISSVCTTPSGAGDSPSSPLSHFARTMETEFERCQDETSNSIDDFRRIGMDVVRGIPSELSHVRKAGSLDIQALRLAVSKLHTGLQEIKSTLEKLQVLDIKPETRTTTTYDLTDDVFREKMTHFIDDAETQVSGVQTDLELVLASVKDISVYFYGEADTAKSTQPLKVFLVMREFLVMLEQACKDVMKASGTAPTGSTSTTPPNSRPPSRPRSLVTASK